MIKKFGLDFGTTNSAIAVEENGTGKVLEIDDLALDKRVIRSILYFLKREMFIDTLKIPKARLENNVFMVGDIEYRGKQESLIGQAAVLKYLEENKDRKPGTTRRFYTGRFINTKTLEVVDYTNADTVREYYEDIDYGIGRLMQALKTALKSPSYQGTTIFGQYYSLEELINVFISTIKAKAAELMGEEIDEVVCGRPVKFSDDPIKDKAAQDRLENALKLAGFKKVSFQFEPVAAAKQFLSQSQDRHATLAMTSLRDHEVAKQSPVVFVFDFGGGTLDTAIVKGEKVLAADGVYIGGDLLNADIFKAKLYPYFGSTSLWSDQGLMMPLHLYESLGSWFSIPTLNNPETMQLLERLKYKNTNPQAVERLIYLIKMNLGFDIYEAIEKAKKELSINNDAMINFSSGLIDINEEITRDEFEEIINERVEEIREVIIRTLKTAKLEASEVDVVVRTGGSSLIPVFENLLVEIFGKEKIKQFETFTSIAAGLAL